eukprot:TRINITY_DN12172_c0_g2_i2.p1 TRINITY_DN12172_c0_g2~~TRINITY_DN12172_c0_g2_i2.p1  ORF type:complete len:568 (-),score=137.12 TRINITY_DN12172_c0_g2_i2:114-1664(-)
MGDPSFIGTLSFNLPSIDENGKIEDVITDSEGLEQFDEMEEVQSISSVDHQQQQCPDECVEEHLDQIVEDDVPIEVEYLHSLFKFSAQNFLPLWAKGSDLFAYSFQNEIIVSSVLHGEECRVNIASLGTPKLASWNPCFELLLIYFPKKNVIALLSVANQAFLWKRKLADSCQINAAEWSPDGSKILLFLFDFSRVLILENEESKEEAMMHSIKCSQIPNRRFEINERIPLAKFNLAGDVFAIGEREQGKDFISFYYFSKSGCTFLHRFVVETFRMEDFWWCSNGNNLLIQDFSPTDTFHVYSLNGVKISTIHLENSCELCLSSSSKFALIGHLDNTFSIVTGHSWRNAWVFTLPSQLCAKQTKIFEEQEDGRHTKFEQLTSNLRIWFDHTTFETLDMTGGMKHLLLSFDDRFVAVVSKVIPKTVWIFSLWKEQPFAVMMFRNSIMDLAWNPSKNRLAICTATNCFYIWTPGKLSSAHVIDVPDRDFCVESLLWNNNGKSLLLSSKNMLCCCDILD